MSTGNFKHDLFSQFTRVAKALSHGYRLEMRKRNKVDEEFRVKYKIAEVSAF